MATLICADYHCHLHWGLLQARYEEPRKSFKARFVSNGEGLACILDMQGATEKGKTKKSSSQAARWAALVLFNL
jgi:hypothetical protein